MRIAITGANSAAGQAILRCTLAGGTDGNALVAAVRSQRAAEQIAQLLGTSDTVARISYDDPASLDAAFRGAAGVIHLAGILVEHPGSTYEEANIAPTRSVLSAALRCGAEKLVLVSATGANEQSSNGYYRSKGLAEKMVRESGLSYTILRAPLLLGPGTEGSAALVRNASGSKARLIGGGRNLQQPLCVDDLARAAIAAAQPWIARNRTLDVVGPVSLPERELVTRAASLLGHEIRITSISKRWLCFALAIRRRVGGPGFSPDVVEVITADTQLDPQLASTELGIQLTGLDEMIKNSSGQGRKR